MNKPFRVNRLDIVNLPDCTITGAEFKRACPFTRFYLSQIPQVTDGWHSTDHVNAVDNFSWGYHGSNRNVNPDTYQVQACEYFAYLIIDDRATIEVKQKNPTLVDGYSVTNFRTIWDDEDMCEILLEQCDVFAQKVKIRTSRIVSVMLSYGPTSRLCGPISPKTHMLAYKLNPKSVMIGSDPPIEMVLDYCNTHNGFFRLTKDRQLMALEAGYRFDPEKYAKLVSEAQHQLDHAIMMKIFTLQPNLCLANVKNYLLDKKIFYDLVQNGHTFTHEQLTAVFRKAWDDRKEFSDVQVEEMLKLHPHFENYVFHHPHLLRYMNDGVVKRFIPSWHVTDVLIHGGWTIRFNVEFERRLKDQWEKTMQEMEEFDLWVEMLEIYGFQTTFRYIVNIPSHFPRNHRMRYILVNTTGGKRMHQLSLISEDPSNISYIKNEHRQRLTSFAYSLDKSSLEYADFDQAAQYQWNENGLSVRYILSLRSICCKKAATEVDFWPKVIKFQAEVESF